MSCKCSKYKFAAFSGYLITPENFGKFVCSLPVLRDWEDEEFGGDPFVEHITRYAASDDEPSVTDDRITHMFFATRYVPYECPSQLDESHPDSEPLRTKTEKDRAMLNKWKEIYESVGGKFDRDMVTFGIIKEWHSVKMIPF
ncbi:hypothetical protein GLOTRDRAFT_132178 [Gloeophyllum trabeum ATCC 11539]|uniref:Uncharacterized protein n=1 Tax=Gloeophyllum trabeum (strain ATCC 11539 / FP-39264 / Madison 617) TaxID=670483 RepID=S7RHI6_GLOTA|nr:uncharacterized protein GLOTRDRAFT_132178 [Gloeophyllum trabeum ATCC 11539]EPQ52054.1 hypothetical protein GLOTRDRAFT_132178 [Gloeophyllum trabeum ATCC 11539]